MQDQLLLATNQSFLHSNPNSMDQEANMGCLRVTEYVSFNYAFRIQRSCCRVGSQIV